MARYQVVVVTPFLYAGRQVVPGEVLALTATEALRVTYNRLATWPPDRRGPRPVPPRKKRRRPTEAA